MAFAHKRHFFPYKLLRFGEYNIFHQFPILSSVSSVAHIGIFDKPRCLERFKKNFTARRTNHHVRFIFLLQTTYPYNGCISKKDCRRRWYWYDDLILQHGSFFNGLMLFFRKLGKISSDFPPQEWPVQSFCDHTRFAKWQGEITVINWNQRRDCQ